MDISGRGLLAVGRGQQVEVWRDAFSQKQSKPYLTHRLFYIMPTIFKVYCDVVYMHRVKGEVCSLEFCPYEDCLGIGHALGVSSMIVPGQ